MDILLMFEYVNAEAKNRIVHWKMMINRDAASECKYSNVKLCPLYASCCEIIHRYFVYIETRNIRQVMHD